jgi:hypothetical protein
MTFLIFFTSFKDTFGLESVTWLLLYACIPLSDGIRWQPNK